MPKPKSEAQRRKLFALEKQGKLKKGEAKKASRKVKGKRLPKRIGKKYA